ncbi:MAG: hypothetical protein CL820_10585 [Croceicoccus sp.]|nr:hypothetical protein [Croceicoccus sp.]MAL26322.1 hypothetical protein [Croceicoccus sp.]|tara:strand:+ start:134315 stop:134518 length:204 start_codon:yes stop_codon:yes gene_type:complete
MLMNSSTGPAKLLYGPNGFRQMTAGDHVVCAVTGAPIPLDMLRYWSVERQEPYATAEIATQRLLAGA